MVNLNEKIERLEAENRTLKTENDQQKETIKALMKQLDEARKPSKKKPIPRSYLKTSKGL